MLTYKDLDVWNRTRKLVKIVYLLTEKFPKSEIFGLTSQIRRCVISVPLNIAEGCGRYHKKDIIRFMYISRGSLNELETILQLAQDLNIITTNDLEELLDECLHCKRLLNGFIKYVQKAELKV
jgi:four helix bundle protein